VRTNLICCLTRYYTVGGLYAGKIWCLLIALTCIYWIFIAWWQPKESIQLAPDMPVKKYHTMLREEVRAQGQSSERRSEGNLESTATATATATAIAIATATTTTTTTVATKSKAAKRKAKTVNESKVR